MPTISAASTPSRKVMMNACNMTETALCHFENEFQFQLYRIVFRRWHRQRAKSQRYVICITRRSDEVKPPKKQFRVAAENAWLAPVLGTASLLPGTRVSVHSAGYLAVSRDV